MMNNSTETDTVSVSATRVNTRSKVMPALFVLTATAAFVLISTLKIDAFRSWRYTADIFPFDIAMTETLRGNIGLDFFWGNSLGDHSYLFLLVLTPLKAIFGNKMIYLLLLLGPLSYLGASLLFHYTLRQFTTSSNAFLLSIVQLIGFTYVFPGLYEHLYGMHPEVVGGYLMVALCCLMILREHGSGQRLSAGIGLILAGIVLLKEEMTLITAFYFLVVLLLSRKRKYLWIFAALTFLFLAQLVLIETFRTPFNRSTSEMVAGLVRFTLTEDRATVVRLYFTDVYRPAYWIFLIASITLYMLLYRKLQKRQPFVDALFLAGIVKILFSIATVDYNLYNFHNFPGVLMVVDAFLLRFVLASSTGLNISKLARGLAALSIICLMTFDLYFFYFQVSKNNDSRNRISAFTNDLEQMKRLVDPERVVAIQHFSHKYWIGQRYTTFSRGVLVSPVGLADYIVFPINLAQEFSSESRLYDAAMIPATFEEYQRNQNFVLFRRIGLTGEDRETRNFFARYGLNPDIP